MAQITLKNPAGNSAGSVELDDAMFGIQPNIPVMHQVVTAQLARRRAGTQSTKTRAEVRGGGAKPYRQKGTGNARQGSIRAPHYSGGGVALGPKPRKYGQRTPQKMIKLALRSALSDRAAEGKVLVVDSWGFDSPTTKGAVKALGALGLEGRILVVVDRGDAATALSFRNLPEVQLIQPGELNAYDVLCNDWIVFTQSSLAFVEDGAALSTAKSKIGPKVNAPRTAKLAPEAEAVADSPTLPDDPTAEPADATEEPEATTEANAEPTDVLEDASASAPDRSDDDAKTGWGSAGTGTSERSEPPTRSATSRTASDSEPES